MKQVTTLFLKLAVIFIGIPVLALCIFLVPKIGNFAGELYPNIAYLKSLVLIDMYAAAIPFYFALYQAFKLLTYIEKNNAFSELSLQSLKVIKKCTFTVILFILLAIVYLRAHAQFTGDDAAGPISLGLMGILATSIIAAIVDVFQKPIKNVMDSQPKNN